jgi:hypothetical protein
MGKEIEDRAEWIDKRIRYICKVILEDDINSETEVCVIDELKRELIEHLDWQVNPSE